MTEAEESGSKKTDLPEETKQAEPKATAEANTNVSAAANAKAQTAERRSILSVAAETMRYIEKAEKDKTIHFRTNDRNSIILVVSAFLLEIALLILFLTNPALKNICIGMALVADVLFGLAILWFVLLRFGVLRTVEPRHALLCWQLMIGAGALFAFYTMNISFLFFTLYNTPSSLTPPL